MGTFPWATGDSIRILALEVLSRAGAKDSFLAAARTGSRRRARRHVAGSSCPIRSASSRARKQSYGAILLEGASDALPPQTVHCLAQVARGKKLKDLRVIASARSPAA